MSSSRETIVLAEWLSAKTPRPPADLAAKMNLMAADRTCAPTGLPDMLVETALSVFNHLRDDRDSALDLLAADALITYAMQAAADNDVSHAASSAMARIAKAKHQR